MLRALLLVLATALPLSAACGLVTPVSPPPPTEPTSLATREQASRTVDLHVVSSWQPEGSWVYWPVAATINARDYLFFRTWRHSERDNLLTVLDITDPTSPKEAAHLAVPERRTISGLVLRGTTLYANLWNGYWIVDVSDPTAPRQLSVLNDGGRHDNMFLVGNYLYANTMDYRQFPSGIQVIDVSNPSSPKVAANASVAPEASIQEASGNRLYLTGRDGLRIMDVSSPLEPRQIGFYSAPYGIEGFTPTGSDWDIYAVGFFGVAVSGNYAFVTSGLSGLRVLDISDPSNIREVTKLNPGDLAYGISIYGNLALLWGVNRQPFRPEMLALDIGMPDDPRLLDTMAMPDPRVDGLVKLGDHIYFASVLSLLVVGLYAD